MNRRTRAGCLAVLAALGLALAGCQNGARTQPVLVASPNAALVGVPKINDVCGLVTAAEAKTALDEPVMGSELKSSFDNLARSWCTYRAAAPDSKRMVEVELLQTSGLSAEERKKGTTALSRFLVARAAAVKAKGGATTLSGLGDAAFWASNHLYVISGENYFTILVGDEKAGSLENSNVLARKMLARVAEADLFKKTQRAP